MVRGDVHEEEMVEKNSEHNSKAQKLNWATRSLFTFTSIGRAY